jgi:uncharacterized protein YutE (UPF0331/DUF86 family)
MTPRHLDRDTVHSRLRLMNDLLDDLAEIGEVDVERLRADRIARHAVERILTQLVELAVAVNGHMAAAMLNRAPADYRDSFRLAAECAMLPADLATDLARSVGLRNVLTHEYVDIDLAVVASSVGHAVASYRRYVREIARRLQE